MRSELEGYHNWPDLLALDRLDRLRELRLTQRT